MLGFAKKLFGSSNDRKVKAFQDQAQRINVLEPKFAALSDDELRALLRGESVDPPIAERKALRRGRGQDVGKLLRHTFAPAAEARE